jgi:NAD(P)-dependent dehydrogenase (short-subunit alcohol dehydrogenase family)
MQLEGQVAIVTGAASGLGNATAKALAGAGAKVVLVDRDADRVAAAAKEIGGRAEVLDVSDAAAAEATFTSIVNDLGPPRVLVNCAGIAPGARIVGREGAMPLADFEQVIRVNLIGSFNMLRLAAAAMSSAPALNDDGERGVIINTASVAAFEGQIGQAAYSASKGGVAALTLPAARDLARSGIRVLAIAPGILKTPMVAGLPEPVQESLGAAVPFPSRLGHPEEYASLVMEMIRNTLLNGETIRLDGALRLAPK